MELHTEPLWERVVRHLQSHTSDSISGIARALSAGRDKPLHRLTVAGCLQVMQEMGVLREVSRPPSIHYQLQDPRRHRTIYERIHDELQVERDALRRNRLACASLQHLFQRPVFLQELHQAGCTGEGLEVKAIGDDARRKLKERVEASGKMAIPARDPLLVAEAKPLDMQELLRALLLDATASQGLRHEGSKGHQTSLAVLDE